MDKDQVAAVSELISAAKEAADALGDMLREPEIAGRIRDAVARLQGRTAWMHASRVCPFSDPTYTIHVDHPCPVCGDIGRMTDEPSKCIDDVAAP